MNRGLRVGTLGRNVVLKPLGLWGVVTIVAAAAPAHADPMPERPVILDITTRRLVYGEPYDLAGKRIVFTNWYYVQPGDVGWVDRDGKGINYETGSSGPFEARHVGPSAPHGIRIMAQKPGVIGPLEGLPYRGMMQEGKVYKGWTSTHYLESNDGTHWEAKAKIVFKGHDTQGTWHVFVDPSGPPAERYKAVWSDEITRAQFEEFRKKHPDGWDPRALFALTEKGGNVFCLCGAVSPDGIHWNGLSEPISIEFCDTHNTCYYDAVLHKYVLYTRYWSMGPRSLKVAPDIRNSWTHIGRRSIGRSETSDFRIFEPSEAILEPTADLLPSEALYTNCHTTIPGGPDQHLMFPTVWNASVTDTTRIKMASSHDGKLWEWVPGGDILDTAPFGQWNGGCIWVAPELMELPNGDWVLPYRGDNLPHKYPRGQRKISTGFAIWPKGRLVALDADDRGEFAMVPVIAPGKVLKINALTRRTGWVRVEVGGVPGRTFADCNSIIGDQLWTRVTWKGAQDTGIDRDKPILLRFQLYQARIFGIEFE